MIRWIRRLFLIFCFVGTCLLICAGVYARKQGFSKSWRDAIEDEFTQRNYHVEIGKLTLGAFRGLVAEDVKFFETAERKTELGILDDVYLDVDLSRILNKEISVNTLDIEKARLSLPLDPNDPNGPRLEVANVSGRVVVTESNVEIVSASAEVAGIEIQMKGSLLKTDSDAEAEENERGEQDEELMWSQRRKQFARTVEVLQQFEFLGKPPVLAIEFRGDLDNLGATDANIRLQAENFRRRDQTYEISEMVGKFRYDGQQGEAVVDEWTIRDARGDASISGSWSGEEEITFSAESSIDLSGFLAIFSNDPRLQEIVFFDPPSLHMEGTLNLPALARKDPGFPGKVIGEFQSDRFVTRGRVFSGIDFGFSASGEKFYLRNLRLDHKTGVAFLNLKYEPGLESETVQYQTEIKLDPNVFHPFIDDQGRKFLDAWSFNDESTVYLAAAGRGASWDFNAWENRGVIDLRNFKLNGVEFLEMESRLESGEGMQWFRDVSIVHEKGKILAELARHDIGERLWEVKGVVSTVNIQEGARAFSPQLARSLESYEFATPPTVRLEGILDSRRPEEVGADSRRTDLAISFESNGTARYSFLGHALTLGNLRGEIDVNRSRVHLTELRGEGLGGTFELEYDARNVRSPSRPFASVLRVREIPLEAITMTYNDSDSVKGSIEGELRLSGNAGQVSSYQGSGIVQITDGNLFAIPVLGRLSKAISNAEAGREDEGKNIVREARATVRIENGVVRTEDLEALADFFQVRSAGSVSLVTQEVDLEAVVNTRGGLSRAILTPVSELLTFSCTGTIKEPVWKAKHISNLGKLPAKVITEMTNVPVGGLKAIGKGLFGEKSKPEAVEGDGVDPRNAPEEKPRKKLIDRLRQPEGED